MAKEDNLSTKERTEVKKEIKKALLHRAKKPLSVIHQEFKTQVSGAIIAAFGFVIALAWKDLIVKLLANLTKTDLLIKYPYLAQLYTALIITIFAVIGILLISRWAQKPEVQT